MMQVQRDHDRIDLNRKSSRNTPVTALGTVAFEELGRRAAANDAGLRLTPPPFPPGTIAWIYQPARSAITSGRANSRRWVLDFEPRAAPFIEPLMGWTGSSDTLRQIKLTFPTKEAAVSYARRQGLTCVLREPQVLKRRKCPAAGRVLVTPSLETPPAPLQRRAA